jgi:CelD/BcsL family acetyltransferase involved in cellulose biosynthesis
MSAPTVDIQPSLTPAVIPVDPRRDARWRALSSGPHGSLFTSPPWISAVCATYGFTPNARLALDDRGEQMGGFAWVPVTDVRGHRLRSFPFSDWTDPIAPDETTWYALVDGLLGPDTHLSLRCHRADPPRHDPLLQAVGEVAWHSTRLDTSVPELHRRISPQARHNIRKAEQAGVRIEAHTDIDGIRDFHRMHVSLRKRKYRMLAQPLDFFERIWEQFSHDDAVVTLLARIDGDLIAGAVFLAWNNVLYFKFGSSVPEYLQLRPNDAIYWAGIRYAAQHGMAMVDWGVSDLDQPGLLRFKRKFASDEQRIVSLSSVGTPSAGQADGDRVLAEITRLFVDKSVPDEITEKAGALLYRYFC